MNIKLTQEEKEALNEVITSYNYSVFIKVLIQHCSQLEYGILNEAPAQDFEDAHRLALAKGKQLGVKEVKEQLRGFKKYCKKLYNI